MSLLSVRLGMAVAISVMVGLPPLPDPGKPRKQLCHTSIKVRNSKLGFTTTIYSSNNNNNHTFFSKFWHNSRVYRVQQIPARGSFLGAVNAGLTLTVGSLATWSSDLQGSVFASRGCGGFWLLIDLLSIIYYLLPNCIVYFSYQ